MHTKPFRGPWANSFPNVWIHADESTVKKHSSYAQAKAGDIGAAVSLVAETINVEVVRQLEAFGTGKNPVLISVHAEEAIGVNAIPEVLADFLAYATNWELEELVVQANVVNHTGAGGFARLSRQAIFEGEIEHGRNYIIVDDFIGQRRNDCKSARSYPATTWHCHWRDGFDRQAIFCDTGFVN